MTDEQINKAIAESIGWKWVHLQEQIGLRGVLRGYPPNVECVGVNQEYVTDYCNDLNAMHEAIRIFDYEQCEEFEEHLCDICERANDEAENPASWRFAVVHATAHQRAEAFLRTLNLWTE